MPSWRSRYRPASELSIAIAMTLESGSLAAHVPPSAIGFRVDGADMTVIDQGTDFGVRPDQYESATELHVSKGAVDMSPTTAGNPTPRPTKCVRSPDR